MASAKKSKKEEEPEQHEDRKTITTTTDANNNIHHNNSRRIVFGLASSTSTKTPTKRKAPRTPNPELKKNNAVANGKAWEKQKPNKALKVSPSSSGSREIKEEEEEHGKKKSNKSETVESPIIKKKERGKNGNIEEDGGEEEDGTMCRFPMARIKRIMKSEDSALQSNQDAVFLVNKATEKFIEEFCEQAYECSVRDKKKSLGYKHLSSVVGKQRRFDFLSDFVPEKLKAEDALAQRKLAETGEE